jgi:hypothetical protein
MTGPDAIVVLLAVVVLARVGMIVRARQQGRGGHGHARERTPRRRGRGCRSGKVPFASKSEADQVVRRSQTRRRPGYDRALERSYRCPHCGYWHTTSQRKRVGW